MQDIDQLMTDILGVPKVKNRALRDLIDARMKKGGEAILKRGLRTLAAMDTGKVEMRRAPGAKKAEEILSGAAEFLPFVGAGKAASEGDYPSAALQGALDVAGGSLVKGAAALGGKALPALAGIFIGPKSKVWNKDAAKEFLKLEKSGMSNKDAYLKTGTFRSPDGILRQEIDDSMSRLRRERMIDLEQEHGQIKRQSEAEQQRLFDAVKRGEMTQEAADAEWENVLRSPLEDRRVDIAMEEYPAAKKLATPGKKVGGKDPQLIKTLYHPPAFEAYPKLKYLKTEYRVDPSIGPLGEKGYLTRSGGTSWSASDAPKLFSLGQSTPRARNIMLHEMQHAIQRMEGMGLGGNPNMEWGMLPSQMHPTDYVKQLQDVQKRLMDERLELEKTITPEMRARPYNDPHPDVVRSAAIGNRLLELQDALRGLGGQQFEPLYKRMAGEAEARAVQKRMDMTPEERRATFPLESYDVPIEELVVRQEPYKKGGAVQAAPYGLRETSGMPKYAKGGEVRMADGGEADSDDNVLYASRGQRRYGDSGSGEGALKSLYGMALNQAQSELKDAGPQAITDVANGILADTLGLPVDMVNTMLGSVGLGSKRPIGGSEQIRELMRDYGVTSGTERPLTEAALSILGPGAPRAATKMANVATVAAKRPFTPATLTVEGTAPDLGQGTSYGFRQGLNDVLLADINKIGRRPATTREGVGTYLNEAGELETNPMLAVDIPKAGRIGEGGLSGDVTGAVRELRQKIAQGGVDLNQEAMAAHRFIPLPINDIRDASAMLIKSREGLDKTQIAKLATLLGNDMVVAHNPRLGGIVVYPFGPVGKDVPKEFQNAEIAAKTILGKKAQIQYGVSDYDADRLFMMKNYGDYEKAGSKPMSAEQFAKRKRLQGIQKTLFPDTSGIPGNVKAAPLGGIQGWSRGKAYPTHVQGVGTKPDWQAINYATEERGPRRSSIEEAQEDQISLLDKYHRALVGRNR